MAIYCTGQGTDHIWRELPAAISLQYKMQLFNPAASITMKFAGIPYSGPMTHLMVTLDSKTILYATVDTIRQSCSGESGVITTLTGRDYVAAGMMDNEVQPGYRFQFSRDQMLAAHATPYGASGEGLPDGQINYIIFTRLMTNFDAVTLYCQQTYGSTYAFMGRDHLLRTDPFLPTVRHFSPDGEYPYREAELSYHRNRAYSRLYIETAQDDYGNEYNDTLDNPIASEYEITRVAYYSPSQKWYRTPKQGAAHLIAQSKRDIKRVTLTLPGAHIFEAGERATLSDPRLGNLDNLYIYEHRLDISDKGTETIVVLCEQAYL